ncbi:MAG: 2-oxoacid:ferredoxin oxidoreductase subunit beta [Planctomycetota bacterium]|nr:MAG: 2-oxoacid:ferredoxin oxidoreductase subunit beta [Planctomycetota bacterium]
MSTVNLKLSPKDYKSDQEVRWCPGCGDYSILNQMQKVFADLGVEKHNTVFVSGIGCSSRFPYYMDTYGFHSIHGRAPAIATGVKLANPDLNVWVITGDGDGLSIGAAHMVHVLRRNVGVKIVLFNNRIYGLTKGQYSPTSGTGMKTKSSPIGSIDAPISPLTFALGVEATFVARTVDVDVKHQQEVLKRAAAHEGSAFIEVYQDCNVYNHGAWEYAADRKTRPDHVVYLEHGKPLIFGKEKNKGIRLNGFTPEVVNLSDGIAADDLLIHDEKCNEPTLAYILSQMHYPEFPEPVGVFRDVKKPVFESQVIDQLEHYQAEHGVGKLDELYASAETWEVK